MHAPGSSHAGLREDPDRTRDLAPQWKPSSPPPDPWLGKRLGKYLITAKLGQGGMGLVYEAHDPLLKRQVAIKLLPESVAREATALERFLREGRAVARLNHPNVVTIHEVARHEDVPYIVMELVRGQSAQQALAKKGPFPWREATGIIAQVCRGLAAAHAAGLIHRDIKPDNVILAGAGQVKLADFGLAKFVSSSDSALTGSGDILGTPHYMSPEQCRSEPLDARTDVYSLGASYFALLIGRPLFPRRDSMEIMLAHCFQPIPDVRTVNPAIPADCAAILERALAKDRRERYPTAQVMLTDLEAVSKHTAGLDLVVRRRLDRAGGNAKPARTTRRRRRSARWIQVAAIFFGLWLLGLGVLYWSRSEPRPQELFPSHARVRREDSPRKAPGGEREPPPPLPKPRAAEPLPPAPVQPPASLAPSPNQEPAARSVVSGIPAGRTNRPAPITASGAFDRALRIGLEKAQLGSPVGPRDFHSNFKDVEKAKNLWMELGPKP